MLYRWVKIRLKHLKLTEAIDLVAQMVQRGPRRPHWYDAPIADLAEVIGDKYIDQVTDNDVQDWYTALRLRPNRRRPDHLLSPWTVDSYGRAVRSFFNHLVSAGLLDQSPAARLVLPRLPAKRKKAIDDDDIARLVAAAEATARDHALVLILRDTGVRVGELVSIMVDNIEIRDAGLGRVLVTDEKTHISRYVYFGAEASRALRRYLRSRPYDAPAHLWLSSKGPDPLTTSGVYQLLERVAQRAGVHERWNPHAFRHALAKRLLDGGMNHVAVQKIMGHADVVTTLAMYVQYDEAELARLYLKAVEGH